MKVMSNKINYSPYITVKLLNALKGFYTFKKLENLLGISSQVLWRYTSLVSVPEKNTAEKIVNKLEELKLIDKTIEKMIIENKYSFINTIRLNYDVNFLNIIGYKVWKFGRGNEITVITTTSRNGDPLITIIAEWLKARICPTKRELLLETEKYSFKHYISRTKNSYSQIYVPKNVLKKEDRALIVEDIVKYGESTGALIDLLRELGVHIWGIFIIVAIGNLWENVMEKYKIKNLFILKRI